MKKKELKLIRIVLLTLIVVAIIFGGVVVSSKALAASGPAKSKFYTSVKIEEGDSLWSIASRYCDFGIEIEDYISDIKEMNNIVNERALIAGNYIMIYYLQ